jgi:hypothetical protein
MWREASTVRAATAVDQQQRKAASDGRPVAASCRVMFRQPEPRKYGNRQPTTAAAAWRRNCGDDHAPDWHEASGTVQIPVMTVLICHRRRILDRVVFDKLIVALVHGSGLQRIATPAAQTAGIRRAENSAASGHRSGQRSRLAAVGTNSGRDRRHDRSPTAVPRPARDRSSSWMGGICSTASPGAKLMAVERANLRSYRCCRHSSPGWPFGLATSAIVLHRRPRTPRETGRAMLGRR